MEQSAPIIIRRRATQVCNKCRSDHKGCQKLPNGLKCLRCEQKGAECIFETVTDSSSTSSSLTPPAPTSAPRSVVPAHLVLPVADASQHQDHNISSPAPAQFGTSYPSPHSASQNDTTRRLRGSGAPTRHGDVARNPSTESIGLIHVSSPAGQYVTRVCNTCRSDDERCQESLNGLKCVRCQQKGSDCVFETGSPSTSSSLALPPHSSTPNALPGRAHVPVHPAPPAAARQRQGHSIRSPASVQPSTSYYPPTGSHIHPSGQHDPREPSTRRLGRSGVSTGHRGAAWQPSADSIGPSHGSSPAGQYVTSHHRLYDANLPLADNSQLTPPPHYSQQQLQGHQSQPRNQPQVQQRSYRQMQQQPQTHPGHTAGQQFQGYQYASFSPGNANPVVVYQDQRLHNPALHNQSNAPLEHSQPSSFHGEQRVESGSGRHDHLAINCHCRQCILLEDHSTATDKNSVQHMPGKS